MRRWLLAACALVCCEPRSRASEVVDARPIVAAAPASAPSPASLASSPAPSASEKAAPLPVFVREFSYDTPLDQCVFNTSGPACSRALEEEKNPVARRLMMLLVEAYARHAHQDLAAGRLELPHPEQARFCKDSGPCGGRSASGVELDDTYSCLTRASFALSSDRAEAERIHERACRCNPSATEIPIQAGSGLLGCDKGKKVHFGLSMSEEEMNDVIACAACRQEGGPEGCARTVERLRARDAALSEHIANVHVPRCSSP